jgi:predicted nucleotidyltransferase component of viral defense system
VDVGDGINFEYESIEPIREDDAYHNFRVHLRAKYGKIDRPMKTDVTTGDVITPSAIQYDFPMLFEDKSVSIMAYTLETILAEKYETILRRNIGTTRARDYYDLHTLFRSRKDEIRPDVLKAAVLHTAKKRDSAKEIEEWQEILSDLKAEPLMQSLWDNYVAENQYIGELSFGEVLKTIEEVALMIGV